MAEIESTGLVDEPCSIDLDSGWEQVDVEEAKQAAKAAAADEDADVSAYIVKQVQDMRPRSPADYTEPRRSLPHPCMQPEDSPIVSRPAAWAVAGMSVLYVVWHYIPQLCNALRRLKIPGGKPPCPCCWNTEVQVDANRKLTVGQCYKQLSEEEVRNLQKEGKLGRVFCHGWLKTPFRCAGFGQPELMQAYQYRCEHCPAADTSGRKATKATDTSYFMASDRRLLRIMEQLGLHCFIELMGVQRGERVGMNGFVAKLMERQVVKAGNIKDYVDAMKELGKLQYLRRKLSYLTFAKIVGWCAPKKKQLTIEQCYQGKQMAGEAAAGAAAGAAAAAPEAAAAAAVGPAAAATAAAATAAAGSAAPVAAPAAAPAAAGPNAGTSAAAGAADSVSDGVQGKVKPFPLPGAVPGAAVSQTFITAQLHEAAEAKRPYRRSLIEQAASKATILAADFTHYATKMVHVNGDRAAKAIFNLMDLRTGAPVVHVWTQSVEVSEVQHVVVDVGKRRTAAKSPAVKVVFVDDTRLFGPLLLAFPEAKLVQDGFHVLDRFSRVIPSDNTLKAAFMSALTAAIYVDYEPDVAAVKEALAKRNLRLQDMTQSWRNQRIRRAILEGKVTEAAVLKLLREWEDKVCPLTQGKIVTEELWEVYRNQSVRNITVDGKLCSVFDLMEDPLPRDEIYIQKEGSAGVDQYDLILYWCLRGTSAQEGMHALLNKLFKGGHYSPELAQLLLEWWFYRRSVDALAKGGTNTYGTYELDLIEEIKAAAAAVGVTDEYPGWKNVPLLPEPLPAFGLDFTPRSLLPDAVEHLGAEPMSFEFQDLVDMAEEMDEARQELASKHSLEWDVAQGRLQAGPKATMPCSKCRISRRINILDNTKVECSTCRQVLLDLEEELMSLQAGCPEAGNVSGPSKLGGHGNSSSSNSRQLAAAAAAAAAAGGGPMPAVDGSSTAAAAAATAAAAEHTADEDGDAGDTTAKRRKVSLSVGEKVRRLHGRMEKTPGANVSISRFFAAVETPQEQLLFWKLYNRFTKRGSTSWENMASVWCFVATQRHSMGDFTLSYKGAKELKAYHKRLVTGLAQNMSTPHTAFSGGALETAAAAAAAAQQAVAAAAAAEAAAAAATSAAAAAAGMPASQNLPPPLSLLPMQEPQACRLEGAATAACPRSNPAGDADDAAGADTSGQTGWGSFFGAVVGGLKQTLGGRHQVAAGSGPSAGHAISADAEGDKSREGLTSAATAAAAAAAAGQQQHQRSSNKPAAAAAAAAAATECGKSYAACEADGRVAAMTTPWSRAAAAAAAAGSSAIGAGARSSSAAASIAGNSSVAATAAAAAAAAGSSAVPAAVAAGSSAAALAAGSSAAAGNSATAAAGVAGAAASAAAAAGGRGTVIGGINFPPGYPITLNGRKISQCGHCKTPTQMPDLTAPGQLIATPVHRHKPNCPRRSGDRVFVTGKKKGQTAASAKKRGRD